MTLIWLPVGYEWDLYRENGGYCFLVGWSRTHPTWGPVEEVA